jgi:cytochrome c oxidase subunit 3
MPEAVPSAAQAPPAMRAVASHFESMEQQAHAARLGMWVFLASEMLLFAGLFALFVTYRVHFPEGFAEGVRHNTKVLGSLNTGVLLTSSTLVAFAVHAVREGRFARAKGLVRLTIALGAVFLVIKGTEYLHHFHEGIFPAGHGRFFVEHTAPGLPVFWSLYYFMTGLHAVHVTAGMILLSTTLRGMRLGKITADAPQRMELAAIYWHLVDLIWIFLWPLLYLAP